MSIEEQAMSADIKKITTEGQKIYESIKSQYSPEQDGMCLAIDIGTRDAFLGKTSAEAVMLARKAHPNTIFYVVRIGHSAVETLARLSAK